MTGPTHPELRGARVLITGGSSGIGLITAERLVAAGARVVILARGEEGLADALRRVPGCQGAVGADVAHADEAVAAAGQAAAILGGLDAVVAGAGAAAYGPFAKMEADDYHRTVETTLVGALNTARAVLPELERTHGTLVFIGSVAGRVPVPWLAAYAAAKHGVRGFVRSLQAELRAQRRPVALALISPGPVDTPFWRRARTPDGRLPPEIGGAYRPEGVADEVLRAIAGPSPLRLERTVGGLMLPAILLDSVLPNLLQPALGTMARLGWRNRPAQDPSTDDGLDQPTTEAHAGGGLSSRPSALQKLRR